MEINKDTKLMDILKQYPWLEDEVIKLDESLAVIKTPFGKMMAKKLTVSKACEMANIDMQEAMAMLNAMIEKHEHITSVKQNNNIELNQDNERKTIMEKYVCTACGYVYDPELGDPDSGIQPGTAFEDIPEDWVCPLCGVRKDMFEKVSE